MCASTRRALHPDVFSDTVAPQKPTRGSLQDPTLFRAVAHTPKCESRPGTLPHGVRTHGAFTGLIRRSEAREAASVTFTNTGTGVGETQSTGSQTLAKQMPVPNSPHAQDRARLMGLHTEPRPRHGVAPCMKAHTSALAHTRGAAQPIRLMPHTQPHSQTLLDFKHSC